MQSGQKPLRPRRSLPTTQSWARPTCPAPSWTSQRTCVEYSRCVVHLSVFCQAIQRHTAATILVIEGDLKTQHTILCCLLYVMLLPHPSLSQDLARPRIRVLEQCVFTFAMHPRLSSEDGSRIYRTDMPMSPTSRKLWERKSWLRWCLQCSNIRPLSELQVEETFLQAVSQWHPVHMMSKPASTANPHVIVWTGLLFKPGQNPRKTCHIFSVQTGMNPKAKLDTSSNVLHHMDRED